jgi:hypothetical protein
MYRCPSLLLKLWRGLVLASVFIVGTTLVRWWADAKPPIEIISVRAKDTTTTRGGYIVLDYETRALRACSGVAQRVIVDSQDVLQIIEPAPVLISEEAISARRTRSSVIVPVPHGAAIGRARYQAVLSFQCNPLQRAFGWTIEVRTPTVFFEITDGGNPEIRRLPLYNQTPAPKLTPDKIGYLAGFAPAVTSLAPTGTSAARDLFQCEGMTFVRPHLRRAGSSTVFVRPYCRKLPD